MEGNKSGLAHIGRKGLLPLLLTAIIGCSAPEKMPRTENAKMPTAQLEEGHLLFQQHCTSCHPGGRSGLAPGIIGKPLPDFLVRFQIRQGIGAMPSFSENLLTDRQVKAIAAFLDYKRDQN